MVVGQWFTGILWAKVFLKEILDGTSFCERFFLPPRKFYSNIITFMNLEIISDNN